MEQLLDKCTVYKTNVRLNDVIADQLEQSKGDALRALNYAVKLNLEDLIYRIKTNKCGSELSLSYSMFTREFERITENYASQAEKVI